MRIARSRAAAVAVALAAPALALAQGAIAVEVDGGDGAPLAGVEVRAEHRGEGQPAGLTDASGKLTVKPADLFGARLRPAEALVLSFEKAGLLRAAKVLGRADGTQSVKVKLVAAQGEASEHEREQFLSAVGASGPGKVFLVPFDVPADALPAGGLDEKLRWNLERAIMTHVQSLSTLPASGLAVKLLKPVTERDVSRLKEYGGWLDALAVFTGQGSLEGAPPRLVISSAFVVVPDAPPLTSPVIYVDDEVPAGALGSAKLWTRLSKLWGRSTVLAMGVRDYREARTSGDKKKLRDVRAYLQAERAGAGPGNDALRAPLEELIGLVDRELAP